MNIRDHLRHQRTPQGRPLNSIGCGEIRIITGAGDETAIRAEAASLQMCAEHPVGRTGLRPPFRGRVKHVLFRMS